MSCTGATAVCGLVCIASWHEHEAQKTNCKVQPTNNDPDCPGIQVHNLLTCEKATALGGNTYDKSYTGKSCDERTGKLNVSALKK